MKKNQSNAGSKLIKEGIQILENLLRKVFPALRARSQRKQQITSGNNRDISAI